MSEKTTTSSETYEFMQILTLGAEALLRGEVLMNSKSISGRTKHWIKTSIVNRLTAMNADLLQIVPEEDRRILKAHGTGPERCNAAGGNKRSGP